MKRYLAIFGFVFIGVIAGLIVRGIPIVLQVNAGGGVPQADRNGDVNGDARLDMSDAVYLLLHIFRDGPQPVALAQGLPGELEGPLADIADSLAYESLKNRHDRFVEHGNGTVTDRLTTLMWTQTPADLGDWRSAVVEAETSTFAGHTNWRLPTSMELQSICTVGNEIIGSPTGRLLIYPVFQIPNDNNYYWSSSFFPDAGNGNVWCFKFRYTEVSTGSSSKSSPVSVTQIAFQDARFPGGLRNLCFLVRDIAPNE